MSADRRVAAAPGRRTALTGAAANRLIHRDRAEVDALAVGSGTVLIDDPLLTARGAFRRRPLTRIFFDTRLRTPPSARLFSTLGAGPVIIVSTRAAIDANPEPFQRLAEAGAEILGVAEEPRLAAALEQFAARGIASLIVEGGVALHRAFRDAGLVDRVQIYMTPATLGPQGVAWLEWPLPHVDAVTTRRLGTDTLTEAYVHGPD
jgi:diaminohydroxyphosphoribosylaminopyrimidine deaminase/5-amino-6-(5-phosphoribosylamino)uracil reductase